MEKLEISNNLEGQDLFKFAVGSLAFQLTGDVEDKTGSCLDGTDESEMLEAVPVQGRAA